VFLSGKNSQQKSVDKIKQIKIFTKRLMRSSLVGDYLSAFKGTGLEFDQIREYQLGDDIRFINWNCSAKMNKLMVKHLIEERDRTIILAIDVSGSSIFSSKQELKKEQMNQVAASLAFIANNNKDRVGALFFTDKIEKWIPPSHGNAHVGKIIDALFDLTPKSKGTDINEAIKFLIGLKKRNSVVFMLSDWINDISIYSKILKVASCEYDFIGIRFLDDCEKNLPDVGLLDIKDLESDKIFTIDTRKQKKNTLQNLLSVRLIEQKKLFEKYKIDLLDLTIGKPFITPMINFFKQRTRRQI
jgi:uncharacterized protein (DUF58 family)